MYVHVIIFTECAIIVSNNKYDMTVKWLCVCGVHARYSNVSSRGWNVNIRETRYDQQQKCNIFEIFKIFIISNECLRNSITLCCNQGEEWGLLVRALVTDVCRFVMTMYVITFAVEFVWLWLLYLHITVNYFIYKSHAAMICKSANHKRTISTLRVRVWQCKCDCTAILYCDCLLAISHCQRSIFDYGQRHICTSTNQQSSSKLVILQL